MFSVVLDACALYPAYLRDTLLRMAAAELYRPLWTTAILDEVLANLPARVTSPAAVRAAASAVVTFNLDDFPPEATEPYDIEVLHPDEFLLNQLDLSPGLALDVLRRQIHGYRNPAMDLFDLAAALERCGCPDTAGELRLLAEGTHQ